MKREQQPKRGIFGWSRYRKHHGFVTQKNIFHLVRHCSCPQEPRFIRQLNRRSPEPVCIKINCLRTKVRNFEHSKRNQRVATRPRTYIRNFQRFVILRSRVFGNTDSHNFKKIRSCNDLKIRQPGNCLDRKEPDQKGANKTYSPAMVRAAKPLLFMRQHMMR